METTGFSSTEVRLIIAVLGAIALALIYLFGRPRKPGQGRKTLFQRGDRVEPTMQDDVAEDEVSLPSFSAGSDSVASSNDGTAPTPRSEAAQREAKVGQRVDRPIERIVTLFVAARDGDYIAGSDLIVAAEKAGLRFGDMGIFHRLQDGKAEANPIFSVANMVKPGSFDMSRVDELRVPGVSFFMTLPGPLSALDAWDVMLPSAQRLAELLGARVLDEERNTLGRQRVAHIRDELRAYDRKQERNQIRPTR